MYSSIDVHIYIRICAWGLGIRLAETHASYGLWDTLAWDIRCPGFRVVLLLYSRRWLVFRVVLHLYLRPRRAQAMGLGIRLPGIYAVLDLELYCFCATLTRR